jgi:hypothetical protein
MKYLITVVRSGGVVVEAESREEAMDIVNTDCCLDDVNWDDDWMATDATEQD